MEYQMIPRYRRLLILIILALIFGAASAQPAPEVLVGRLVYLEKKGWETYESEKRYYVHGNTQFMVIEVSRVLFGSDLSGEVIIGAEMDSSDIPGTTKISGSYRVFDPAVWKLGSSALVIVRPKSDSTPACSPLKVKKGQGNEKSEEWTYDDPFLEKHRSAPIFCISGRDLFPISGL
jgi:hypothetical protein